MSHPTTRLGRLPAVHDPRTLRLSAYTQNIPAPPASVHRSHSDFRWPMFANDTIGDCTIAAAGHMIEGWALNAKHTPKRLTDEQIINAYSAVSGYDPSTGENDQGAVELDVLKYWRRHGIASDKIMAFAYVEPRSALQLKQAVWLFGGSYIGINLPITAQAQVGTVWDTPPTGLTGDGEPGSWGGHAVNIVSYDSKHLALITWGAVQLMTWRFVGAYVEEAYALLSPDMLSAGKSPEGFDTAALQADLSQL